MRVLLTNCQYSGRLLVMPSETPRDVGAEIRAEMGRQRLSMSALADSTGIPRSTLAHQINNGPLTVDTLTAIAEALGKEPSHFWPGTEAASA